MISSMMLATRQPIATDTQPLFTIELRGLPRRKFSLRSGTDETPHRTLVLAFKQRKGAEVLATNLRQYYAHAGTWPECAVVEMNRLQVPTSAKRHVFCRRTPPLLDIKEESKHRLQAACALNGITLALVQSANPVAGSLRVRMITGTAPLDSIRQHLSTLCTL